MTVTAPAEVRRDAKAGYCSRCRNGQHALCASPEDRCGCPSRDHPNRPGASPAAAAEPSPLSDVRQRAEASAAVADACGHCRNRAHGRCTTPTCGCAAGSHPHRPSWIPKPAAKAKLREPVWQLVKADPPAPPPKPKKLTAVERARPFVEEIMAADDRDWHRFAVFPSSMAAGQTKARVAKAYREFEFKAVRVPEIGQSALYGRWSGAAPAGQL